MSRLLLLLLLGAARGLDTSKARGPMGGGMDTLRGAGRISNPRRTVPAPPSSATTHGGHMVTIATYLHGKRLNKWVRKPLRAPPGASPTDMEPMLQERPVKVAQNIHPGPLREEGTLPGTFPQAHSEGSNMAPALTGPPKDIVKQPGRGPSAARIFPGELAKLGKEGCNQSFCASSSSIPRHPSKRPASFTHAPVSMVTRSLRRESDSAEQTHQSGSEWNVQHVRGVTDPGSAYRLKEANGRRGTGGLRTLTPAGPGRASQAVGILLAPPGLSTSPPSSSADSPPRSTHTREFVQPVGMATSASKSETLAQEKAKTTYSSRRLRLQKSKLQATKVVNSRAMRSKMGVAARAPPSVPFQDVSLTGGVGPTTLPLSKSLEASAHPPHTRVQGLPVRSDAPRTSNFTPEPTSDCATNGGLQGAKDVGETSRPPRCPSPTGISREPSANLLLVREATFPESTLARDHSNPPSLEAKGLGGLSAQEPITTGDRPPPKLTSPSKQPPPDLATLAIHSPSGMPIEDVLHQQSTQAHHSQPELAPANQPPLTVTTQADKSTPELATPPQQKSPLLNTPRGHFQPKSNTLLNRVLTTQTNHYLPELTTPAKQIPPALTTLSNHDVVKLTSANHHIPELAVQSNKLPPAENIQTNNSVQKVPMPAYHSPGLLTPANHAPSSLTTPASYNLLKLSMTAEHLLPEQSTQASHSLQDLTTPANNSKTEVTKPEMYSQTGQVTTVIYSPPEISKSSVQSRLVLPVPENHSPVELPLGNHNLPEPTTSKYHSFPKLTSLADQSPLEQTLSTRYSRPKLSTQENKKTTALTTQTKTFLPELRIPEEQYPPTFNTRSKQSQAELSTHGETTLEKYSGPNLTTQVTRYPEITTSANQTMPDLVTSVTSESSKKTPQTDWLTSNLTGQTSREKTTNIHNSQPELATVMRPLPTKNNFTSTQSQLKHTRVTSPPTQEQKGTTMLYLPKPSTPRYPILLKQTSLGDYFPGEISTPVVHFTANNSKSARHVSPEIVRPSGQASGLPTTPAMYTLAELTTLASSTTPVLTSPIGHTTSKLIPQAGPTVSERRTPVGHITSELSSPRGHAPSQQTAKRDHHKTNLITPSHTTTSEQITLDHTTSKLNTPTGYVNARVTSSEVSSTSNLIPRTGHTTSDSATQRSHAASQLTTPSGTTSELTTLTSHTTTELTTLTDHATSELTIPRVNTTSELPTAGSHATSELFIQTGHTKSKLVTAEGRIISDVTTFEDNITHEQSTQTDHTISELTAQRDFTTSELTTPTGQTTSKLTIPTVHMTSKLNTSRGDHTSKITTPTGHSISELITLKGYTTLELTTPGGYITPERGTPAPSPAVPDLTTLAGHITPKPAMPKDHSTSEVVTQTHNSTPELNPTADSTTAELIAQADYTVPKPTSSVFPSPASLSYDTVASTHNASTENKTSFLTPEREYNGATQWILPQQTFQTNENPTVSVQVTETPEIPSSKHTPSTGMEGGTQTPEDYTSWNAHSTGPSGGTQTSEYYTSWNAHSTGPSGGTQTPEDYTSWNAYSTGPSGGTQTPEEPSSRHVSSPGIMGAPHISEEPFSWQESSPGPMGRSYVSEEPTPWQESFPGHSGGSRITEQPNSWQESSTRHGGGRQGPEGPNSWQDYSIGHMNGTSAQTSLSEEPSFWQNSSPSPTRDTKPPDKASSGSIPTTSPTEDAEKLKQHTSKQATSTGPIGGTKPPEETKSWYTPSGGPTGTPAGQTQKESEVLITSVTGKVTTPSRAETSSLSMSSGRYPTVATFEATRSSISIRTTLVHQQFHATSAVMVHPTHRTSLSTSQHATSRGVPERSGRIFIVEDQLPILKARELNITFKLALEMGSTETFESVDSLQYQALVLAFEETVSPFYKSVPGFMWLEMLSVREGSVTLEYAAIFNVELINPLMMEHPERLLNLSRLPDAISAGLWVAGHRVLGVSATERRADLCTTAYTCLAGFTCAHNRNGNITCTSLCHDGFCKNEGICTHRRGQDPMCQCPVGSDYWFMGVRCDYRMTQQALLGISCGVILSLVLCISAIAYLAMRRFKALLVETKINQTKSSYRRFSRFDDISTRYWSHSQSQSWLGASISSLDNLAFSHSEEVLHLHALESRRGSSLEDADNAGTCSPRSTPHRRPECCPGFHSDWETSCSSFNDPMVDSGKASAISVSSWPMEPIQWTPFPMLHQLSAQSPFRTRRPHSYCEGMELVNMERSWTA